MVTVHRLLLTDMDKPSGLSRNSQSGRAEVQPEPVLAPADTAVKRVTRSNSMPELRVERAKRGAALVPTVPRSAHRRSLGEEDNVLLNRLREKHPEMMSRVTQALATPGIEGRKAASDAIKNTDEK